MMVQNHAFGTYGPEHAVNATDFVRRKRVFVETRERIFRVIERTEDHVFYRMVEPVGNEMMLSARVFDNEFEAVPAFFGLHPPQEKSFQARVQRWLLECFGADVTNDRSERAHRFFEEAAELAQALGCTREEAHQLVDYVFDRPAGEPHQEAGGVLLTLAGVCVASGHDMRQAAEDELARVSTPEIMAKVRAKNAAKLRSSPLPGQISPTFERVGAGMNIEDLKLALDRQAEAQSMPFRGVIVGVALSLAVILVAGCFL